MRPPSNRGDRTYATRIALRYPNGRTHVEIVETPSPLGPGSDIDLFGHHWCALSWTSSRSRFDVTPETLLCEMAVRDIGRLPACPSAGQAAA